MMAADLVRVGTQAVTAALLIGGMADVWQLAVLHAVVALPAGLFVPASTALVPRTVSAPGASSRRTR